MDGRSRRIVVFAVLAAIALCLGMFKGRRDTSAGGSSGFRVGLVFDVGGRGDKSFNDLSYAGLMRARDELGAYVEMVEPTGAEDREAALRLFAARRFDLVIGVGFIFSRDVDAVAHDYPNVRFACVDYAPPFAPGVPIPPNVTGLAFREQEGSYLAGAVAGLESTTKHVGFVGGMDIPLIHKFEAGYRAGVGAVCPSCVLHVAYAGTTPDAFRDPAKGMAIALAQIAAGADVLFHASGSTGLGVFQAAKSAHVKAIGVDADQWEEAPGTVLTSMTKQAHVSVFDAIKATKEHTLPSGMRVLGLKEEGVDYVHDGPHAVLISPATKARVEALRHEVIAGHIEVPSE
ncbi:MAG: BMP family lipoprotein [Polyangiales bacterium]